MIVVVSGLPRSGTSLMMRALVSAGLKATEDGFRVGDEFNVNGYFEWQEIKQIPLMPELIGRAENTAVKVVSPLLPSLPGDFRYQVVFMRRRTESIVKSQNRMLGAAAAKESRNDLTRIYDRHVEEILGWLHRRAEFSVLTVAFEELIGQPSLVLDRLELFLGRALRKSAFVSCVDARQVHF